MASFKVSKIDKTKNKDKINMFFKSKAQKKLREM